MKIKATNLTGLRRIEMVGKTGRKKHKSTWWEIRKYAGRDTGDPWELVQETQIYEFLGRNHNVLEITTDCTHLKEDLQKESLATKP